jgi:hypothetical protein
VADGLWSQIDGWQLHLDVRFTLPDVITNLYMMADKGPVWHLQRPAADRCDVARATGPGRQRA